MQSFATSRSSTDLRRTLNGIVETESERLIAIGYTPASARFECINILKAHIGNMLDECNAGLARHEFYRDYVICVGDGYEPVDIT